MMMLIYGLMLMLLLVHLLHLFLNDCKVPEVLIFMGRAFQILEL